MQSITIKTIIGATRCQILTPKCTKFNFRWRSPDSLAVFEGPTSKGMEEEGEERERNGRGSKGKKGRRDGAARENVKLGRTR